LRPAAQAAGQSFKRDLPEYRQHSEETARWRLRVSSGRWRFGLVQLVAQAQQLLVETA